jgi:Tfp pilus assembly protein PilX
MKNKIYKEKRGPALSEQSQPNGFTLFVAIIVMGTLLLVATGIASLAVRQALISASGRESQHAFYAADTGIECALFWDVKNPDAGVSAFATTTSSAIHCNRDANNSSNQWNVGGSYTSIVGPITFLPEPFCAVVTVTKDMSGNTLVESKGYNTCDLNNPRRVERAVRARY